MNALPEMRIAIVGSRFVPARNARPPVWLAEVRANVEAAVAAFVATLPTTALLVSGGAPGVDGWASMANRGVRPFLELRAGWQGPSGFGAGLERNAWIVSLATDVYAFWDGTSRGTAHTIREAQAAGKLRYVGLFDEANPRGQTMYAPPRALPNLT